MGDRPARALPPWSGVVDATALPVEIIFAKAKGYNELAFMGETQAPNGSAY
jgi:hypothetical protein